MRELRWRGGGLWLNHYFDGIVKRVSPVSVYRAYIYIYIYRITDTCKMKMYYYNCYNGMDFNEKYIFFVIV